MHLMCGWVASHQTPTTQTLFWSVQSERGSSVLASQQTEAMWDMVTQSLFSSALPRLSGLHLKIAKPWCVREDGLQGGVRLPIIAALYCIWTLSSQRLLLKISLGHYNARMAPRWALRSAWSDAEFGSGGVPRKWITHCSQCVTIKGGKYIYIWIHCSITIRKLCLLPWTLK